MLQASEEQEYDFIPQDVLELRSTLRDAHSNLHGIESFFLSYGLPPLPPFPGDVGPTLEVFGWGDWRGGWGRRVYTDGSGLVSSVIGLT